MPRTIRRLLAAGLAATSAALLAGCATGFLLDNRVQTFLPPATGAPAIAAGATFRYERLPSQQAQPAQGQIEAMAEPALLKAGLRRDDAGARYTVQVAARVQRSTSPWADPWDGWGGVGGGFGWGLGVHGRGIGLGFGMPRMDQPWFQREVGVVIREAAGNRVVYETRAMNDGPWLDNGAVLPVMFEAALQGFPNPPQGERRVDIHVGAERARTP